MEAKILRIKTKKEVEEMSLAAGYREIVNGSIYENSVFAICDDSDWEDYTIAGTGGAYVAHKFAVRPHEESNRMILGWLGGLPDGIISIF